MTASGSAAANSGLPLPHSSVVPGSTCHDVNNADVVNEPSVTTAQVKVTPTIKLSSFDGTTPLESHLAKFENCSEYYSWTEKERLCHLKSSLDGQAAQVLWQLAKDATESV